MKSFYKYIFKCFKDDHENVVVRWKRYEAAEMVNGLGYG